MPDRATPATLWALFTGALDDYEHLYYPHHAHDYVMPSADAIDSTMLHLTLLPAPRRLRIDVCAISAHYDGDYTLVRCAYPGEPAPLLGPAAYDLFADRLQYKPGESCRYVLPRDAPIVASRITNKC